MFAWNGLVFETAESAEKNFGIRFLSRKKELLS